MKPQDDLLQRYQEANAHDPARPGPALRENVLARARAAAQAHKAPGQSRPAAANDTAWRWRALGGLAVLGLATLVVLQFERGTPEERDLALGEATTTTPRSATGPAPTTNTPAEAPPGAPEVAAPSPPAPVTAPRAAAPRPTPPPTAPQKRNRPTALHRGADGAGQAGGWLLE